MTGSGIPYRFEWTASAAELHRRHGGLPPGSDTGEVVSVAGRLMLRRVQGKVAFGTLADSSGRVQLFARVDETPGFDDFCALNLGDWVGVSGEVMTTRRGVTMAPRWCPTAGANPASTRVPDRAVPPV